jgi:DNA-binding transcriptional LysR family regulator
VYVLFDLIDIELLANIAETKSFTQGAVLSHLCLSAASKRIKHVEERLGAKVFYRDNQGIALTEVGKTLYDGGRRILHQMDHLVDNLQDYTQGAKGQLRIFAPTTVSTEYLPATLCRYLGTHKGINVDLRMRSSREVVRAVGDDTADIGIIARSLCTDGLELLPYRRERWVVVAGLSHPLAKLKSIRFDETLDFEYVSLPETSTTQAYLNEAADTLHRTLKVRVQAANLAVLCRMAEANLGIGILPESIARQNAKSMAIRTIPLSDDWAKYNMQICVRDLQSLPKYAHDLIDLLGSEGAADFSSTFDETHQDRPREESKTRHHRVAVQVR